MSISTVTISKQYTIAINALCEIAESYFYLGKLDEAIRVLGTGIHLIEANEVSPYDQARLLLQYGKMLTESTFHTNRSSEEALAVLFRAKQIAETIKDDRLMADVLDELGQAHFFRAHKLTAQEGDYDTALAYFQQAVTLREAIHDQRGLCASLVNVGRAYQNAGQNDKAEAYFVRAVALPEQQQDVVKKAEAIGHLGILAASKVDLDAARCLATEALAMREEIGARIDIAYSHLNVAEICHIQGDLSMALKHYQKGYTLAEETHVATIMIFTLIGMGYLHLDQEEIRQAQQCFEKAYAVAQSIGLKRGILEATEGLEEIAKLQK